MKLLQKVPGLLATTLMILFASAWAFWGANEMYHEGWWGAWWHPLPYLAPAVVTMIPTLVALRWPIPGALLIIGLGIFTFLFFGNDVAIAGLAIVVVGMLFLIDGVIKGRKDVDRVSWWQRRGRYLIATGAPLLVLLAVSAYTLPTVLSRIDDHDRRGRRIEGNGVALIWAPEGPGWNPRQSWGGYPSWQSIALYGLSPLGFGDKVGYAPQRSATDRFASSADMQRTNVCRFLSADGMRLDTVPQNVWRMPTTDELVRSLVRHGQNAGCSWAGTLGFVPCALRPDKESPLWATDHPAIYYWTAESYSERSGYYVSFNGAVNATYKAGGNPRHSYRCVKP